jgi:elongation factor P
MQVKALELRNNSRIELDGEVYVVTSHEHHTPGKGRAVVRLKIRHVKSGRVTDKTFTSTEKIELADMEFRKMGYLYREADGFVFMDNSTFEQLSLPDELVGDSANYLIEGLEANVAIHKGIPIDIELPPKVDLKVVETVPGVKGDTVNNVTKAATVETGAVVQVPLFIDEGEKIRVDTRDGSYVERAN